MGHRHNLVATLAVLAIAATMSSALADSRIFTAHSDQTGVTIDQAFHNGDELAIVGHGDNATLFRIDSPSTPVGCANRIEFVASTGEHVDLVSDMCALNWDVTVKVQAPKTAEAPAAPATPEVPDVPAVPAVPGSDKDVAAPSSAAPDGASFSQVVSVSLDDPSATIIAIRLDDKPVNIIGRKGGGVQFEVAGTEEGIACDRNLSLILANGKQISRKTNICLNDWSVVVAVAETGPAPAPAPQPLPTPPVATAPEPPVGPAPNQEMVWIFSTFGDGASLGHGIPETDASNFGAVCRPRSGRVLVTLLDSGVPGLAPGGAIPITFSGGGFSRTYPGIGSPVDEMVGASLPQVDVSVGDELWTAIVHERALDVSAGPSRFLLSLNGSAGPTREFLAACAGSAVAPPHRRRVRPSGRESLRTTSAPTARRSP